MSYSKFNDRFKNKSSTVSMTGILQTDPNNAISKLAPSQIHNSVIQSSAAYMINRSPPPAAKNIHSSKPSLVSPQSEPEFIHAASVIQVHSGSPNLSKIKAISATPIISKLAPKSIADVKDLNRSYDKKNAFEFKPYTLKDYHIIKPKTYYQLGGLGASNIGSNEWLQKKGINDKRNSYGKNVYYANAAKLPLLPVLNYGVSKDDEENSRARAIKFAKTIKPPPLRVQFSPS